MEKEIAGLRNSPSFLEEITQKRDELEALRHLLGVEGAPREDIEYKKMLLEHERWKTEKTFEIEKWRLEREMSEGRMNAVLKNILSPFIATIAPLLSRLAPGTQVGIKCGKCGEVIPVDTPLPDSIECSRCGTTYVREGAKLSASSEAVPVLRPEEAASEPAGVVVDEAAEGHNQPGGGSDNT
ncbi:MAG: hypothetical protein QW334_02495 [Thermofilum sp.]